MTAAQREQWNDGSNTLCIAPGTVVTYERNYVSNELMEKKGIKVLISHHQNFQEEEAAKVYVLSC